jgi:methylenetetrahydrofolate dehydrogenase (NADP+)/methenyltetrahydrofolate cyclohydrolase
MNLINGRLLADKIKDTVAKEVFDLCANPANKELLARRPSLALLLVGERPDSQLYVNLKDKAAKEVGIDTNLYKFDDGVAEAEILDTIKFLNADETIDGILIQLPLPEHLDTDKIIETINPEKDVDGFHPDNIKKLETCLPADAGRGQGNLKLETCAVISPVFQSVLACLVEAKFDLTDKNVAIVAKPGIFIDSLDKLLEHLGAQVALVEPSEVGAKTATADLLITAIGSPSAKATGDKASTTEADLIITAVGQADLITGEDIKDGAVLIDIGICKDETGKTCGDVDATSVQDKAGWLTPVPGGIGPMTIAFALKNTLEFFKKNLKK